MTRPTYPRLAAIAFIAIYLQLVACSSTPTATPTQFKLRSDILNETRTIQIDLQTNYTESDDAYPVLVVLDGESYFHYFASIITMISPHHLPEMIIVGLPNTDRYRDLDPIDETLGAPGAGTARFRRFLAEELFPHLDQHYRTHPHRVLAGHSLGGTSTLHTFAKEPALFQAYIATSPAVSGQRRRDLMQRDLKTMDLAATSGAFVFISGGGDEGEALSEGIQSITEFLDSQQAPELQVESRIYAGEGHFPIKGFYEALRLHFAGWFPREEFDALDWPAVERHYEELSSRFGYPVHPPAGFEELVARRAARR